MIPAAAWTGTERSILLPLRLAARSQTIQCSGAAPFPGQSPRYGAVRGSFFSRRMRPPTRLQRARSRCAISGVTASIQCAESREAGCLRIGQVSSCSKWNDDYAVIVGELELSFDPVGAIGVIGQNNNHDPARPDSIRDRLIPSNSDVQVSRQNPTSDADGLKLTANRVRGQLPGRRMIDKDVVWHSQRGQSGSGMVFGPYLLAERLKIKPLSADDDQPTEECGRVQPVPSRSIGMPSRGCSSGQSFVTHQNAAVDGSNPAALAN